jgi:hypothetical protein
MESLGKKGVLIAAVMSACELAALSIAHAEPPLQKVTAAFTQPRASKAPERAAPRLDLRPPSQMQASEPVAAEAPAGAHRLFNGESLFRSDARDSAEASGHIMSPMQNLAHNFRQEGLPVAKLFQNSSSLVHVGLNPKGKPGLWIVHKVH